VIDTLNRSLVGSESVDKDMAAYIRAATAIQEAFDCLVVIIHHCGVDDTRPRGHTSQTGATDVQISVKKDAAGIVTVAVDLAKDMEEGATFTSRLERVVVGVDQDGDEETTCVVVPCDAVPITTSTKLSPKLKLALRALADCPNNPLPSEWGLPAGLRGVTLSDWRTEIYRRDILDPQAGNPREELRRIKLQLAEKNLIGERDSIIWRKRREAPCHMSHPYRGV